MFPSPTRMFLTKGVGVNRHPLSAFELALRDADIEQQNLVYVSSILPPHCAVITREEAVELLKPGDITFCVLARSETNEVGRRVYASLPEFGQTRADPEMYGYISELHGFGMAAEASGEQAEDLAATMLASTLGLDFDPDAAWNERRADLRTQQSGSSTAHRSRRQPSVQPQRSMDLAQSLPPSSCSAEVSDGLANPRHRRALSIVIAGFAYRLR